MSVQGEQGYLDLLNHVISTGDHRETRNGWVRSLFGERLSFDLKTHGFPLLTSKKMYFKGVVAELLWFLRGQTDNQVLRSQGVHIWDGNSSREALDARGLTHHKDDDCGPIYGYQWRRFGAPYHGAHVSMKEVPLEVPEQDQLAKIIRQIREDPMSRRMVLSAWNPCQLKQMCLEPCHVLYQFYVRMVDDTKYLSCQMYQRSADLFLGVPFNIASTALLTSLLAQVTGCIVDSISLCFGDVHVYEEHVGVAMEQLTRRPFLFSFPKLVIKKELESLEDLELLLTDDLELADYQCHGALRAPMKV